MWNGNIEYAGKNLKKNKGYLLKQAKGEQNGIQTLY